MPNISHEDLGIPEFVERILSDYEMTEGHQRGVVLGFLLVDIANMLGEDYIIASLNYLCGLGPEEAEIAENLHIHFRAYLSKEPIVTHLW